MQFCRCLAVGLLAVIATACLRERPSTKAWSSIPDSAALATCRDSLKGRHGGRCTVELAGGRFVLFRDSAAGADAFLRYWNYSLLDSRRAYAQRRAALEAQLGPGHQCKGQLVVWPDRRGAVLLDIQGPDHPEIDSVGAIWAVVVGVAPRDDASGMYERLCSEQGAA